MSTLKSNTNISADGIRDNLLNHDGNGSTATTALGASNIWQRQPRRNGAANNGTSTSTTNKFSDFGGTFKTIANTSSFTTGTTKGAVTQTVSGWGTTGGVQAATNGAAPSNTSIGVLYDGTNFYNGSTPKPFDALSSSFDGNKWVSFIGHVSSGGLFPVTTGRIVMEGNGAQTTDTDWTYLYWHSDITSNGGNSIYDQFDNTASSVRIARTDALSVQTISNRVVYSFEDQFFAFMRIGLTGGTVDFTNYYTFE